MPAPVITEVRFRVSPYMPVSGTLDGEKFKDVFRIRFKVTVPKQPECEKYKIHVEVYEHDIPPSSDDLVAASPFGANRCYEMKPGEYTFYIGSVDPFGNKLPANISDVAGANNELSPGNYQLPAWSPIVLNGDPGDLYEFYAVAALVPCCENGDETSLESQTQESKTIGGPDAMQTVIELLERLVGTAGSAAVTAAKGG